MGVAIKAGVFILTVIAVLAVYEYKRGK